MKEKKESGGGISGNGKRTPGRGSNPATNPFRIEDREKGGGARMRWFQKASEKKKKNWVWGGGLVGTGWVCLRFGSIEETKKSGAPPKDFFFGFAAAVEESGLGKKGETYLKNNFCVGKRQQKKKSMERKETTLRRQRSDTGMKGSISKRTETTAKAREKNKSFV